MLQMQIALKNFKAGSNITNSIIWEGTHFA